MHKRWGGKILLTVSCWVCLCYSCPVSQRNEDWLRLRGFLSSNMLQLIPTTYSWTLIPYESHQPKFKTHPIHQIVAHLTIAKEGILQGRSHVIPFPYSRPSCALPWSLASSIPVALAAAAGTNFLLHKQQTAFPEENVGKCPGNNNDNNKQKFI